MLKLNLQYFGHLMRRPDSLEKDFDARKHWRQKEKRAAEDAMVRQHHWLNAHEQTLEDSLEIEGQGSLVCCSSWGRKELDTIKQLNNNNQFQFQPCLCSQITREYSSYSFPSTHFYQIVLYIGFLCLNRVENLIYFPLLHYLGTELKSVLFQSQFLSLAA